VAFVPYCGSPPAPGALHWNLDPVLSAALLMLALAHFRFARSRGVAKRDMAAGAFGWLLLSLAFISPLCNLSVALFSARVTQHMIIALLAAPMIARGLVFAPATRRRWGAAAWIATLVFAAIFWIWHSPVFYDETLRSNVAYWLMHATTVAAALAL
jgi:putative membrane protein